MQGEIQLVFGAEHPAFAGHFPGAPILPGVVLLDAAVHALLQAARSHASEGTTRPSAACQVSSTKFLSPVGPDETLSLRYRTLASGYTHFEIAASGRKVAEGTLVLSPGL